MPQDDNIHRRVEQACVDYERDLRAFLAGVLRDSHLAEDAFQKTVVRAIETETIPEPDRIRGWLFQISLNVARDLKRRQAREQKNRQAVHDVTTARLTATGHDSITRLISAEEIQLVQQALLQLKPDYREVITRRLQRGQTFAEIADDLGRPLGTVLTWMRRALQELRGMTILRDLFDDISRDTTSTGSTDSSSTQ